jgi:hypothetical protein
LIERVTCMMDEAGQKSGEVELRHYSTCPVLAGQAQSAEVTLLPKPFILSPTELRSYFRKSFI